MRSSADRRFGRGIEDMNAGGVGGKRQALADLDAAGGVNDEAQARGR